MTEAYQCDECREYRNGPPPVTIDVRDRTYKRGDEYVSTTPREFDGIPGDYCYDCAREKIGHGEEASG